MKQQPTNHNSCRRSVGQIEAIHSSAMNLIKTCETREKDERLTRDGCTRARSRVTSSFSLLVRPFFSSFFSSISFDWARPSPGERYDLIWFEMDSRALSTARQLKTMEGLSTRRSWYCRNHKSMVSFRGSTGDRNSEKVNRFRRWRTEKWILNNERVQWTP